MTKLQEKLLEAKGLVCTTMCEGEKHSKACQLLTQIYRGLDTKEMTTERPKLTVRQQVIKQLLLYLTRDKREVENRIYILRGECRECGHVIIPRNPNIEEELKTDKWASTGAICLVCGKNFGWWCPKSPDHVCHYSETEDHCDYCGMSDERK